MFKGEYTDDVTDEVIENPNDMVVVSIEDKATKELRQVHLSRESYDDLLEGNLVFSDIALSD